MGELLRHSKELIHPVDGKPFRANDPEEYINRLHHFAAGLGFNPEHLTSGRNPAFTSKGVSFYTNHGETRPNVTVSTDYLFDEGMLNKGLSESAWHSLYHGPDWNSGKYQDVGHRASKELAHRSGMDIVYQTVQQPGSNTGVRHHYDVSKMFNDSDPNTHRYEELTMDKAADTPGGAQKAIKDISSRFRDFNRNRKVDKPAIEVANNVISNPDQRFVNYYRSVLPGHMSSQFLGAIGDGNAGDDYIDLHTGTWAKLDPNGYFPH